MRLAWFTPLPPLRSGIAAYSAELLPLVAARHQVDVFLDTAVPDQTGQLAWATQQGWHVPPRLGTPASSPAPPSSAPLSARSANEFLPLHARGQYDLIVYQVGNAACHDYMWPYLLRFPGLTVLHDGSLHHARARALLDRQRLDDYRREFRANHPSAPPLLSEHAIVGASGHHYYRWPMRRLVVERARAVAVHGARLAAELRDEVPEAEVVRLHMGVRPLSVAAPANVAPGCLVFAAFGLATSEKRLPLALEAFATTFAGASGVHFVIVGGAPPHFDPVAEARRLGIEEHVTVTGYVPDEDLDGWLRRADVCVCLRWPTTGETSASWLRCLAAGKPTIVTGLSQNLELASLDARTGTIIGDGDAATGTPRPVRAEEAVCVSVDLVDEREALCQAFRRLATDAQLRKCLGDNGASYWAAHHTLEHMARDYEQALAVAAARTASREWRPPSHVDEDAGSLARGVAARFGLDIDVLAPRRAP